jgi:hypothetical protein
MIWPSSIITTRSATSRAKPISWVTTIIVIPSRASSFMTSRTSPIISGSSAARRLVEQHQRRLHGERPRDRHALLLAARQLGGIDIGLGGEAHSREQGLAHLDGLVHRDAADVDRAPR